MCFPSRHPCATSDTDRSADKDLGIKGAVNWHGQGVAGMLPTHQERLAAFRSQPPPWSTYNLKRPDVEAFSESDSGKPDSDAADAVFWCLQRRGAVLGVVVTVLYGVHKLTSPARLTNKLNQQDEETKKP